ncbi:hypothetical protein [Streptomyces longisporus]|uniref:Uncharacterized protein n=1 Tax=Streptomyces longisporus TaxID=1948 RepID=A0ABP5Y7Y8_STRLO
MTPPPDITNPGLRAAVARLVAADCQTASAPAQLRRHPENHVNRPPGSAPHGPLAATSGTGLMAADQQYRLHPRLRTRRKTIGIHLGASVEQPPAEATSAGTRRITWPAPWIAPRGLFTTDRQARLRLGHPTDDTESRVPPPPNIARRGLLATASARARTALSATDRQAVSPANPRRTT